MKGADFTLHKFSSSHQPSLLSSAQLLEEGRKAIHAASHHSEWSYVRGGPTMRMNFKESYRWAKAPPVIDSSRDKKSWRSPYDWGILATDDEKICVTDLEDFNHSNPTDLNKRPFDSSGLSPEGPSRKLQRSDIGPLHSVIPQPHYHPSPYSNSRTLPKCGPYKNTIPIFIAPYTAPPQPNDCSRCAWFIPVRGSLPWDICSSGDILENLYDVPLKPAPARNRITWTHSSLVSFWNYLLNLRRANSLGPLGLSFNASNAMNPDFIPHVSRFDDDSSSEQLLARVDDDSLLVGKPIALASTDYIKVYHEAYNSMHVRTALNVWSYVHSGNGPDQVKIRLLKGARLALLDERSNGILIS